MSSYEEMVVDRSVDAAWLDFRVRLADHLSEIGSDDHLCLGLLDGDGDVAGDVILCVAPDGGHVAVWDWADGVDRDGARHDEILRIPVGGLDAYVLRLSQVLIAEGAPHPAFVMVVEGDLVLVEPPAEEDAPEERSLELPEAVMPASRDDLLDWVDVVVTERLGRVPTKRPDGSIGMSRDDDRLDIRVSGSRPIIEVWATVAKDVDVRKARKLLGRLNARSHFFSFSLVGDRLLVSTSVNANPFCPAHLNRAIDSTFGYLADDAGKVRVKVARPVRRPAAGNAIDPDLLLLYGSRDDRKAMIQMARILTNDSRSSLGRWRDAALEAGKVARHKAAAAKHGPVQNALIEQYLAWRSVAAAITEAVDDIVDERRAA